MIELDKINKKLKDLYVSKLIDLKKMYAELHYLGFEDYTNPLFLKCHEGYTNSKKRILFVGQETNSWYHEEFEQNEISTEEEILTMQNTYLDFLLSQTYVSSFWNFIYDINKRLNDDKIGYMWSNVFKIGKKEKGKPKGPLFDAQVKYFNIGSSEIKILQPDIIVFLTGPHYDDDISRAFGDFDIIKTYDCCFDQIRMKNEDIKAYRIYHPNYHNYLGSEKKQQYKEKLIHLLEE